MNRDDIPGGQAEAALIGCLMVDSNCAERIADCGLEDAMFGDTFHRLAYRLAVDLQSQGKDSDVMSLLVAFEARGMTDTLPALNAIAQSVFTSRNARMFAAEVIAGWKRRELIRAVSEAHEIAMDAELETGDAIDQIQTLLGSLRTSAAQRAPTRLYEVAMRRVERLQAVAEGNAPDVGWPVGIPSLDGMLGGFRPGHLYILAARPSVGKSSFAEEIALRLARAGHPALFLSQEMPDAEVADRAISNVGQVSYDGLAHAKSAQIDWDGLATGLEVLEGVQFWVDDQPALTFGALRRKAMSKQGLQVLVVDYIQLCATAGKQNRAIEIGEISRGLKALAKERGLAVIALSQLNREVEKRASGRPTLADLRDSGEIEQDADAVIFLWRDGQQADETQQIGCAIEKNRQGKRGAFALAFNGDQQRWAQSTESLTDRLRTSPQKSRGLD